ncbi:MAG: hypothetical protein N2Z71_06370 [Caloramator sp.]|nr:hypothetical protein [Caloramator sp.]
MADRFYNYIVLICVVLIVFYIFSSIRGVLKFKIQYNGKFLFKVKKRDMVIFILILLILLFLIIFTLIGEDISLIKNSGFLIMLAIMGFADKYAVLYSEDRIYVNGKIIELKDITKINFSCYLLTCYAQIFVKTDSGKERICFLRLNKEDKPIVQKLLYDKYDFYKM